MSTWVESQPGGRLQAWHAIVAIALTLVGFVATRITVLPVFVIEMSEVLSLVASVGLGNVGYLVVGLVFLYATGRGIAYLDVDTPSEWKLIAGVTTGILALRFAIVVPSWILFPGFVPAAPAGLEAAYEKGTIIAVMIPMSLFVVAPAEEFLYRGVIQKYLREVFTPNAAIAGSGLLYALVHWFTLGNPTTLDAAITMGGFVIVGLSFCWLYERTGTILAPIVAHGVYNSVIALSTIVLYHPIVYPEERAEVFVAPVVSQIINWAPALPL